MIVLDTNVLSAVMRVERDEDALAWFAEQSPADLFTTTITEAEIRYGQVAGKDREEASLKAGAFGIDEEPIISVKRDAGD